MEKPKRYYEIWHEIDSHRPEYDPEFYQEKHRELKALGLPRENLVPFEMRHPHVMPRVSMTISGIAILISLLRWLL